MIRFEDFELSVESSQLVRRGETIPMEPQVFDVLVYLVTNCDRLISKGELLDNIWGDRFVSESALTSRIKSVRRALDDDGRSQRLIRNYHGRGYQFVGEVLDGDQPDGQPTPVETGRADGSIPNPVTAADNLTLSVDEEFGFVGRAEVLAWASEQLEGPLGHRTSILLIGGEPGIGKTRLATEIARRAADLGAPTAGGRCDRHLSTSLQPWREALGLHVATADREQLEADTAGLVEHLKWAFPAIEARLGVTSTGGPSSGDEYATIDAIVVFLERLALRQPMVVVIDDVQWAEGATRALTSLLLRRGVARMLVVLTFRTTGDDIDAAALGWLAELGAHPGAFRVDLEGLPASEVATLAGGALGSDVDPGVVEEVWRLSEGQPLFATELLRDLRSGIGLDHMPETIAALVRTRIERMPAAVSRLVRAAAALGQDFNFRIAAEAANLDLDEALDAIDTALGAELIHEVDGSIDEFRFSHQLVPAAVLDMMSRSRRVRLHGTLVEILERHERPSVEIAHHLLEASPMLDTNDVVARVRVVAASAIVEHEYDSAAGLLARLSALSVDLRTHAEVLAELGRAYNKAGRQPQALQPLQQLADIARGNGWVDLFVVAALELWGQSPFRASQDRSVIPLLDEALGHEAEIDDATTARLLAKRAAFKLFVGALTERDEESKRAVSLVGDDPSTDRLEVLEARWMAVACPAMVFDIGDLDRELQSLRKELGALTTDACAPEISLYWQGRGSALRDLSDELRDDPRQRRDVDQWRLTALSGMWALFEGDLDGARSFTDRALPLGREPWGEAGQVVHGLVHLLLDMMAPAPEGSLERWRRIAADVPSDPMRASRAWVEAACGNRAESDELLDAIAPRFARMTSNFMGGFGLVGFSEAVLLNGRDDLVDPARQVLEPLADRMLGHPWAPSLAAADVLARLDEAAGDIEAARAGRNDARSLYERLGATALIARLDETGR